MSIILFLLILILTFIGMKMLLLIQNEHYIHDYIKLGYKYYFGGKIEYYDSSSTKILPSFFISHSNPSLPLEKDFKLYKFLHNFQKDQLRGYAKPKGADLLNCRFNFEIEQQLQYEDLSIHTYT